MRTCLALFIIAAIFLSSAAFAADRVVARVGNEAVTSSELAAALEQNPDLGRQEALNLLIERRLVLVWAEGKGITAGDEEVDKVQASIRTRNNLSEDQFEKTLQARGESLEMFRSGLREQLIINKALDLALAEQTRVTEEELQDLYLKTYPRQMQFEVAHILVPLEEGASAEQEASAREEAGRILSEIKNGASFEAMAREYSRDPSSAADGGRLGTFHEGELIPELEKAAASLEPGEVTGPIRTAAGYHILKLLSKKLTEPPSFSEVRNALENRLMREKEEPARDRWLEELRNSTYVEIFPDDGQEP